MTREFTRLTQRFGGVLAVAAVVAFVGGTTATIAAHEDGKDSKKEDKRKDKEDELKKKVWRKFWMCHVEKDGKGKLMEISEQAVAAHRGHGDGEPGERVARHRHHRWTRDCREQQEPPAPPPPPPPPPPADPTFSCACWNGVKRSQLLSVLAADSSPAGNTFCINDGSTVSLSQDEGISTLVYASTFGQCIQRVGGVDVGQNFVLSPEEAATCLSEAAGLVPSISWCPQ